MIDDFRRGSKDILAIVTSADAVVSDESPAVIPSGQRKRRVRPDQPLPDPILASKKPDRCQIRAAQRLWVPDGVFAGAPARSEDHEDPEKLPNHFIFHLHSVNVGLEFPL
jgi:hypothetical protein